MFSKIMKLSIFEIVFIFSDEEINQELQPWKDIIDVQGEKVIGSTLVTLSKSNCRYAECTLGDFVTDAMVYSVVILLFLLTFFSNRL